MSNIKETALYVMQELEGNIRPTDTICIRIDELNNNFIIDLKDESDKWYASRAIPINIFISDERLAKYIEERKEKDK